MEEGGSGIRTYEDKRPIGREKIYVGRISIDSFSRLGKSVEVFISIVLACIRWIFWHDLMILI